MKLFESWKSYFYGLLLHPTQAKVLVRSRDNRYFLPAVQIDREIWLSHFQPIQTAMARELRLAVNVLHYANYRVDRRKRQVRGSMYWSSAIALKTYKMGFGAIDRC